MKYTAINIPSLERIAKALEKQNKLQEKAIEQSERKDNEWEAYLLQQMVVDILQFVYGEEK